MSESFPTFNFVEIAETNYDSRQAADKENTSRPAQVEIQQASSGLGQHRLAYPIEFPVIFRNEPHYTCGSAVSTGPDYRFYHDPRGSSGVWGWQRSSRGYYTGAYVWLRVDCEQIAGTSLEGHEDAAALKMLHMVIQHYLTFSGIAIKALPTSGLSANLNPRTVGL